MNQSGMESAGSVHLFICVQAPSGADHGLGKGFYRGEDLAGRRHDEADKDRPLLIGLQYVHRRFGFRGL